MIVDADLPRGGGVEWLRSIRASGDRTPAIVITENPDTDFGGICGDEISRLEKPYKVFELGRMVRDMLAQRDDKEAVS